VELTDSPADFLQSNALSGKLQSQLNSHGKKFLCAYSGGLDSSVLLHVAAKLPGMQLRAIHIHHGLHANADTWAEHCIEFCRALGVDLVVVNVEVKKDNGKGIEAAARSARYQAIAEHIEHDEILLTAHHQQDQAETFLQRLLRGSGSQGLGAMRAINSAHGFTQLRPLLSVSKAALQSYANAEKLSWVEDSSNDNTDFDRNFLRHEIMPMLERRWPQAVAALSRSADLLAEEHQCLRMQSDIFLAALQDIDEYSLSVSALMQHPKPWRAQILRAWTESLNTPPLPAHILQEIELTLLPAKPDAEAQVTWQGTGISRWHDCLYLSKVQADMPQDWQCDWNGAEAFSMPNGDQWGFEMTGNICFAAEPIQRHFGGNLLIRLRQGGEKILLENREHHSLLKNCLQELGIPPWERRRLPLLYTANGECLAMGDVLASSRFKAFCELHKMRFLRRV
jgi:tRNA(Ile)-lysidine synthase